MGRGQPCAKPTTLADVLSNLASAERGPEQIDLISKCLEAYVGHYVPTRWTKGSNPGRIVNLTSYKISLAVNGH